MSFISALAQETNYTVTENGALTNVSSLDPIVDFFGLAGAMRATPEKAADLFNAAYLSDPLTAVRTLFYMRDVRGGLGERDVFRACFKRLPAEVQAVLMQHIPEYGRWDDVLHVGNFEHGAKLIASQIHADLQPIRDARLSQVAKWMPSENASSKATKELAKRLRSALGLSSADYRRILSKLRRKIHLLEQDMSSREWDAIDHAKVPSQAHRRHVKAFHRHTPEKYQSYLDSVAKGEKKINVNAVYPYEIYKMATKPGEELYAQSAWVNLPDYTRGTNALVMADTSGSMFRPWESANPIAVSVSLALYFAERNTGIFNRYFMTFDHQPRLLHIPGGLSLADRVRFIENGPWGMNTDLLAALRAILRAGQGHPDDMPSVLYIISDMQFDQASHINATTFQVAKAEYEAAGLTMPHIVFWNVSARHTQVPVTSRDENVTLVSGLSPTIFAQVVEGKSPRELVDRVVNGARYLRIVL